MLGNWLKHRTKRKQSSRAKAPARAGGSGSSLSRSMLLLERLEERVVPVLFLTANLQVVGVSNNPTPAIAGAAESFVTTIRNSGPNTVYSVNLHQQFNLPLSNLSFSPSVGTYSPATGEWTGFTLPPTGTLTLTATGTSESTASGDLGTTVTLDDDPGVYDPDVEDNFSTDLTGLGLSSDLSITNTDNVQGVLDPGGQVVYTIVVSNSGPSTTDNARVTDLLPAGITSDTWTATASNGASVDAASGSGNINNLVSLSPGATVTFSITGNIDSSDTAPISNTASVTPPFGVSDPNLANNSATDKIALTADLAITNTDNVSSVAEPGDQVVYTVFVSSAGPSAVTGATVMDNLPAGIVSDSWTAVASSGASITGASSGTGNIDSTVNLNSGSNVTFTITATIDASQTGTLATTATVTAPSDVTDPVTGNNSATDTLTLNPTADLAVTNTDNVSGVLTPNGTVVYTVVVSSTGPSSVNGATVTDNLPAGIASDSWTAVASSGASVGESSGTGSINTTVDLMSGANVTFTITAVVSSSPTSPVTSTANVTAPSGVTDPTSSNNSATDTLSLNADLGITNTDNSNPAGTVTPGTQVVYTLVVSNSGPSDVTGATVTEDLPSSIASDTWTTSTTGGASVTTAGSGSGNISSTVNLPEGSTITYTITAQIAPAATGALQTTATVTQPTGVVDPVPGNNSATDTLTLAPSGDLAVSVTDNTDPPGSVNPGSQVVYTVVVSNTGPSTATAALVSDTPPVGGFSDESWTTSTSGGATVQASNGSGAITNNSVTLPPNSSVTFTVTAVISTSASGTLTYSATVTAPSGFTDTNLSNNTGSDTVTIPT